MKKITKDKIWMQFAGQLPNVKDRAWMWFVGLLPKQLILWAAVRLIAYATAGKYGDTIVPELTAVEALKRWDTA